MIGPQQITSWLLRTLSLNPERALANAAPTPQQRRRDRADQFAAIRHRHGTRSGQAKRARRSARLHAAELDGRA
jgi:hypothetical protein